MLIPTQSSPCLLVTYCRGIINTSPPAFFVKLLKLAVNATTQSAVFRRQAGFASSNPILEKLNLLLSGSRQGYELTGGF